jgi:hypothetical protein
MDEVGNRQAKEHAQLFLSMISFLLSFVISVFLWAFGYGYDCPIIY